jgi:hypothetical protein
MGVIIPDRRVLPAILLVVIASQRVRPEVAGPMTSNREAIQDVSARTGLLRRDRSSQ